MRIRIWTMTRSLPARVTAVLACVGAAFAIAPGSALATLWVSASGTDSGYCSQANPCASISRAVSLAIQNDTIYVGSGVFHDHVAIPASITGLVLQGAGMHATTVDGGSNGGGSVFTIDADTTVTINDMSITGGQAPNGGGINSAGVLTLERDDIALNIATGSPSVPGSGGGVYSQRTGSGVGLTVLDSAIVGNKATGGAGGGIAAFNSSAFPTAVLSRDLIYANRVVSRPDLYSTEGTGGGALVLFGSMTEDTITGNEVVDAAGHPQGSGGGVLAEGGGVLTSDTIVGNTAATGAGLQGLLGAPAVLGTILDGRCTPLVATAANLVQDASCGGGPGTLVGLDPMLGPLQDNGGPTPTLAISTSSPAYDANPNVADQLGARTCAGTDQRGISDLQRGAGSCDIGAYQVQAPTTYVANPAAGSAGSVTAYSTDATGDASPVLTLSGANTGLSRPQGVLADVAGDVFVANPGNNSITEYAPEVTGNVAPVATIAGPQTLLNQPQDVAVAATGHLFVTNLAGSVTEYAPGATGNVAPVARIAGSKTRLSQPHGIVIDPQGNIRVTNANRAIETFSANAKGNVAPLQRLAGGSLQNPQGLNFDPAGQLVVADAGAHRVGTFAPNASGTAHPLSALTGAPALQAPTGLDLDEPGHIFVADSAANSVFEYPAASSGGQAPLATIAGPGTGLSAPALLSELPPTPAPRLRVSAHRRSSRREILIHGIALQVKARNSMAFRGERVRLSASARVARATIASARPIWLRPGSVTVRLVQSLRAATALRRHHRTPIVITVTLRDGSGIQRRHLTITCTG
jgi:streptogramin lyase